MDWIAEDETGAAEYDRMTTRQIAVRDQEPQQVDQAEEIRAALIADCLEGIRFWQEDIGVMVALREAFPGNSHIFDWTRHFINMAMAEIETLTEEVERWKKWA